MARRPSYKREIKRGSLCAWPEDAPPAQTVAAEVTYTGNPKHKTYLSPAGQPAYRSDAARCDKDAREDWPRLLDALRQGILEGYVSGFRGKFPFRVWVWINDVLHEARLTNEVSGDYHGFPINDPIQYPEPLERVEAAPRVQIPVA